MASSIFRVQLVAKEQVAKTRAKVLTELETTSAKEADREITRLQEMTSNPAWRIPYEIIATRATISDFERVYSPIADVEGEAESLPSI